MQNQHMDLNRPPLRWMVTEAGAVGLRTERFKRELKPSDQIRENKSLNWKWWLLELCPFKRLTFEDGSKTTRWSVSLEMAPFP